MDSKNIKSLHLADEIIEEILSRLPVQVLLKFRCVSKSWLSLISSQRFVETHLRNSIKDRAFSRQRVILKCYYKLGLHQCSLQQLLHEPSSIKPCRFDHLPREAKVVGCCNGLICLVENNLDLYLWNPATMISMKLPKLEHRGNGQTKVGFGWDGRTRAYKVFVFVIHRPGIAKAYVYSSNTNSWKTMEDQDQGTQFLKDFMDDDDAIVVFACGKLYLLKDSGGFFIISLDLESEEFGRIEQPFIPPPLEDVHVYAQYYKLAEIGGCLHLLLVHGDRPLFVDGDDQQPYAVVWVIKDSGWFKLFTVPLSSDDMHPPLFGGGPNGEIFVIFHDIYFLYFPKHGQVVRERKNIIGFFQGHVYAESLVSPNATIAS